MVKFVKFVAGLTLACCALGASAVEVCRPSPSSGSTLSPNLAEWVNLAREHAAMLHCGWSQGGRTGLMPSIVHVSEKNMSRFLTTFTKQLTVELGNRMRVVSSKNLADGAVDTDIEYLSQSHEQNSRAFPHLGG